jgi:hypothetical protein
MLMHVHNESGVQRQQLTDGQPTDDGNSHCEGPPARFRRGSSAQIYEAPRLLFHFDRVFTLRQHQAHPSTFT